jgi:uncharacterized protein (DUF2267 family)
MTTTHEIFDATMQKTAGWLKEIQVELGLDTARHAYGALRATLHAVRDHLPVEHAAHLGAQLPLLVRGVYYEGWKPSGKPLKERHKDEFLAQVQSELRDGPMATDCESTVRAVLAVLRRHVSEGEVENVKQVMPAELKRLWTST